jgi:hypothetical protein
MPQQGDNVCMPLGYQNYMIEQYYYYQSMTDLSNPWWYDSWYSWS